MPMFHIRISKVNHSIVNGIFDGSISTESNGTINIQVSAQGAKQSQYKHITPTRPVRKILVSATLTQNPAKISSLHLINPQHYSATPLVRDSNGAVNDVEMRENGESEMYTTPEGLKEYLVMCNAGEKPLLLIYLLMCFKKKNQQTIVFTGSVSATHRLRRLLDLYDGDWVSLCI